MAFFETSTHQGGEHDGKFVVDFWDTCRGSLSHRQSDQGIFVAAFDNLKQARTFINETSVEEYAASRNPLRDKGPS